MLGLRRNGACSASDAEVAESMSIQCSRWLTHPGPPSSGCYLATFSSQFLSTEWQNNFTIHHGKVKLFALLVASAASIFQSFSLLPRRRKGRLPGIGWKQYMCSERVVGANSWQREFWKGWIQGRWFVKFVFRKPFPSGRYSFQIQWRSDVGQDLQSEQLFASHRSHRERVTNNVWFAESPWLQASAGPMATGNWCHVKAHTKSTKINNQWIRHSSKKKSEAWKIL